MALLASCWQEPTACALYAPAPGVLRRSEAVREEAELAPLTANAENREVPRLGKYIYEKLTIPALASLGVERHA